jgi:hypothetical protein
MSVERIAPFTRAMLSNTPEDAAGALSLPPRGGVHRTLLPALHQSFSSGRKLQGYRMAGGVIQGAPLPCRAMLLRRLLWSAIHVFRSLSLLPSPLDMEHCSTRDVRASGWQQALVESLLDTDSSSLSLPPLSATEEGRAAIEGGQQLLTGVLDALVGLYRVGCSTSGVRRLVRLWQPCVVGTALSWPAGTGPCGVLRAEAEPPLPTEWEAACGAVREQLMGADGLLAVVARATHHALPCVSPRVVPTPHRPALLQPPMASVLASMGATGPLESGSCRVLEQVLEADTRRPSIPSAYFTLPTAASKLMWVQGFERLRAGASARDQLSHLVGAPEVAREAPSSGSKDGGPAVWPLANGVFVASKLRLGPFSLAERSKRVGERGRAWLLRAETVKGSSVGVWLERECVCVGAALSSPEEELHATARLPCKRVVPGQWLTVAVAWKRGMLSSELVACVDGQMLVSGSASPQYPRGFAGSMSDQLRHVVVGEGVQGQIAWLVAGAAPPGDPLASGVPAACIPGSAPEILLRRASSLLHEAMSDSDSRLRAKKAGAAATLARQAGVVASSRASFESEGSIYAAASAAMGLCMSTWPLKGDEELPNIAGSALLAGVARWGARHAPWPAGVHPSASDSLVALAAEAAAHTGGGEASTGATAAAGAFSQALASLARTESDGKLRLEKLLHSQRLERAMATFASRPLPFGPGLRAAAGAALGGQNAGEPVLGCPAPYPEADVIRRLGVELSASATDESEACRAAARDLWVCLLPEHTPRSAVGSVEQGEEDDREAAEGALRHALRGEEAESDTRATASARSLGAAPASEGGEDSTRAWHSFTVAVPVTFDALGGLGGAWELQEQASAWCSPRLSESLGGSGLGEWAPGLLAGAARASVLAVSSDRTAGGRAWTRGLFNAFGGRLPLTAVVSTLAACLHQSPVARESALRWKLPALIARLLERTPQTLLCPRLVPALWSLTAASAPLSDLAGGMLRSVLFDLKLFSDCPPEVQLQAMLGVVGASRVRPALVRSVVGGPDVLLDMVDGWHDMAVQTVREDGPPVDLADGSDDDEDEAKSPGLGTVVSWRPPRPWRDAVVAFGGAAAAALMGLPRAARSLSNRAAAMADLSLDAARRRAEAASVVVTAWDVPCDPGVLARQSREQAASVSVSVAAHLPCVARATSSITAALVSLHARCMEQRALGVSDSRVKAWGVPGPGDRQLEDAWVTGAVSSQLLQSDAEAGDVLEADFAAAAAASRGPSAAQALVGLGGGAAFRWAGFPSLGAGATGSATQALLSDWEGLWRVAAGASSGAIRAVSLGVMAAALSTEALSGPREGPCAASLNPGAAARAMQGVGAALSPASGIGSSSSKSRRSSRRSRRIMVRGHPALMSRVRATQAPQHHVKPILFLQPPPPRRVESVSTSLAFTAAAAGVNVAGSVRVPGRRALDLASFATAAAHASAVALDLAAGSVPADRIVSASVAAMAMSQSRAFHHAQANVTLSMPPPQPDRNDGVPSLSLYDACSHGCGGSVIAACLFGALTRGARPLRASPPKGRARTEADRPGPRVTATQDESVAVTDEGERAAALAVLLQWLRTGGSLGEVEDALNTFEGGAIPGSALDMPIQRPSEALDSVGSGVGSLVSSFARRATLAVFGGAETDPSAASVPAALPMLPPQVPGLDAHVSSSAWAVSGGSEAMGRWPGPGPDAESVSGFEASTHAITEDNSFRRGAMGCETRWGENWARAGGWGALMGVLEKGVCGDMVCSVLLSTASLGDATAPSSWGDNRFGMLLVPCGKDSKAVSDRHLAGKPEVLLGSIAVSPALGLVVPSSWDTGDSSALLLAGDLWAGMGPDSSEDRGELQGGGEEILRRPASSAGSIEWSKTPRLDKMCSSIRRVYSGSISRSGVPPAMMRRSSSLTPGVGSSQAGFGVGPWHLGGIDGLEFPSSVSDRRCATGVSGAAPNPKSRVLNPPAVALSLHLLSRMPDVTSRRVLRQVLEGVDAAPVNGERVASFAEGWQSSLSRAISLARFELPTMERGGMDSSEDDGVQLLLATRLMETLADVKMREDHGWLLVERACAVRGGRVTLGVDDPPPHRPADGDAGALARVLSQLPPSEGSLSLLQHVTALVEGSVGSFDAMFSSESAAERWTTDPLTRAALAAWDELLPTVTSLLNTRPDGLPLSGSTLQSLLTLSVANLARSASAVDLDAASSLMRIAALLPVLSSCDARGGEALWRLPSELRVRALRAFAGREGDVQGEFVCGCDSRSTHIVGGVCEDCGCGAFVDNRLLSDPAVLATILHRRVEDVEDDERPVESVQDPSKWYQVVVTKLADPAGMADAEGLPEEHLCLSALQIRAATMVAGDGEIDEEEVADETRTEGSGVIEWLLGLAWGLDRFSQRLRVFRETTLDAVRADLETCCEALDAGVLDALPVSTLRTVGLARRSGWVSEATDEDAAPLPEEVLATVPPRLLGESAWSVCEEAARWLLSRCGLLETAARATLCDCLEARPGLVMLATGRESPPRGDVVFQWSPFVQFAVAAIGLGYSRARSALVERAVRVVRSHALWSSDPLSGRSSREDSTVGVPEGWEGIPPSHWVLRNRSEATPEWSPPPPSSVQCSSVLRWHKQRGPSNWLWLTDAHLHVSKRFRMLAQESALLASKWWGTARERAGNEGGMWWNGRGNEAGATELVDTIDGWGRRLFLRRPSKLTSWLEHARDPAEVEAFALACGIDSSLIRHEGLTGEVVKAAASVGEVVLPSGVQILAGAGGFLTVHTAAEEEEAPMLRDYRGSGAASGQDESESDGEMFEDETGAPMTPASTAQAAASVGGSSQSTKAHRQSSVASSNDPSLFHASTGLFDGFGEEDDVADEDDVLIGEEEGDVYSVHGEMDELPDEGSKDGSAETSTSSVAWIEVASRWAKAVDKPTELSWLELAGRTHPPAAMGTQTIGRADEVFLCGEEPLSTAGLATQPRTGYYAKFISPKGLFHGVLRCRGKALLFHPFVVPAPLPVVVTALGHCIPRLIEQGRAGNVDQVRSCLSVLRDVASKVEREYEEPMPGMRWPLSTITEVFPRRYRSSKSALEFHFANGSSALFSFPRECTVADWGKAGFHAVEVGEHEPAGDPLVVLKRVVCASAGSSTARRWTILPEDVLSGSYAGYLSSMTKFYSGVSRLWRHMVKTLATLERSEDSALGGVISELVEPLTLPRSPMYPPPLAASGEGAVAELLGTMKRSGLPSIIPPPKPLSVRWMWRQHDLPNWAYLTMLNRAAGRSTNDLSQYPVFPWVLADYDSPVLKFHKHQFRNLARPVGALSEERLVELRAKYRDMDRGVRAAIREELLRGGKDPDSATPEQLASAATAMGLMPPFMYGSHYSSEGAVVNYLIRLEPFTMQHVQLQSGRFDVADRLFHSIAMTWKSVTSSSSDVRELTSEWFGLGGPAEMFVNGGSLPLGERQATNQPDDDDGHTPTSDDDGDDHQASDGGVKGEDALASKPSATDQEEEGVERERVDDVKLPEWAKSPWTWVSTQQQALEEDVVSATLHGWVGLVFGREQRGTFAVEADNVFHHVTYEDAVDLSRLDAESRQVVEDQIAHFGQTPSQLFTKKHPARRRPHGLLAPCPLSVGALPPVVQKEARFTDLDRGWAGEEYLVRRWQGGNVGVPPELGEVFHDTALWRLWVDEGLVVGADKLPRTVRPHGPGCIVAAVVSGKLKALGWTPPTKPLEVAWRSGADLPAVTLVHGTSARAYFGVHRTNSDEMVARFDDATRAERVSKMISSAIEAEIRERDVLVQDCGTAVVHGSMVVGGIWPNGPGRAMVLYVPGLDGGRGIAVGEHSMTWAPSGGRQVEAKVGRVVAVPGGRFHCSASFGLYGQVWGGARHVAGPATMQSRPEHQWARCQAVAAGGRISGVHVRRVREKRRERGGEERRESLALSFMSSHQHGEESRDEEDTIGQAALGGASPWVVEYASMQCCDSGGEEGSIGRSSRVAGGLARDDPALGTGEGREGKFTIRLGGKRTAYVIASCGYTDGSLRWFNPAGGASTGTPVAGDGALPGVFGPGRATAVATNGNGTLLAVGTSTGAVRLYRALLDSERVCAWLATRAVVREATDSGCARDEEVQERFSRGEGDVLPVDCAGIGTVQAGPWRRDAGVFLGAGGAEAGVSGSGQGTGWSRTAMDAIPGPNSGVALLLVGGLDNLSNFAIVSLSLSASSNLVVAGDEAGVVRSMCLSTQLVHRVHRLVTPGLGQGLGEAKLGVSCVAASKELEECAVMTGPATSVVVCRTGCVAAYWAKANLIACWDLNGALLASRRPPSALSTALHSPGDGTTLLAGTARGTLVMLSSRDLSLLRELPVTLNASNLLPVTSVAVAEGGRLILVGDTLGRVRMVFDPLRVSEEVTGRLQEGMFALV